MSKSTSIIDLFDRMNEERTARLKGGWGPWKLEQTKADRYLTYHATSGSWTYDIPLSQLNSQAAVHNWLWHLHEKTWLSDVDFRHFLHALEDLGRVFR